MTARVGDEQKTMICTTLEAFRTMNASISTKLNTSAGVDRLRLVPGAGLEPALCFQNWILNPTCLPISPPRQHRHSLGKFCCHVKNLYAT